MQHDHTQTVPETQLNTALEALDRLSPNAGRVLLLLNGYEQGRQGHCRAKVRTMAAKLELSESSIRRALRALRDWGLWQTLERRMRWQSRSLTALGRLCALLLLGHRPEDLFELETVTGQVTGQVTAHNGKAEKPKNKTLLGNRRESSGTNSNSPSTALEYKPPLRGGALDPRAWQQLALWIDSSNAATSFARCKMAHRHFSRFSAILHRSREFGKLRRGYMTRTGVPISSSYVLARAFQSARRVGADFGSVEAAYAYIMAIIERCIQENRLPGEVALKPGA